VELLFLAPIVIGIAIKPPKMGDLKILFDAEFCRIALPVALLIWPAYGFLILLLLNVR
jgi:hypothetical protein